MTVDEDRRRTARARKRLVMDAMNTHLSMEGDTAATRFDEALDGSRTMVIDSDIDGVVSACMVASVSSWRVGAIVMKSGEVLVAPGFESLDAIMNDREAPPFGLDVFSPLFPTVSNHPVLFGTTPYTNRNLKSRLEVFDAVVLASVEEHGSICPSAWAGVGATFDTANPRGITYKYPLGTAQVLLATLEVVNRPPRMYDRQFLPWLIANCDGGVVTIRTYPWNAEIWWSALAAVAGPASHSEALYRLVTEQRPTEFIDVDRHLRWDEDERSKALNSKWNLANESAEAIATVVGLISDWSAWPDPFIGGAESLPSWTSTNPTRGLLRLTGKAGKDTKAGMARLSVEEVDAHLQSALQGLHLNFSTFKERGVCLGWMAPQILFEVEQVIGPAADPVEELDEDDPSQPSLLEEGA